MVAWSAQRHVCGRCLRVWVPFIRHWPRGGVCVASHLKPAFDPSCATFRASRAFISRASETAPSLPSFRSCSRSIMSFMLL